MKATSRPRAAVTSDDRPIGIEKARNFLSKPPYEPGDKPRFDKGRFSSRLFATWEGGNVANPSAKVTARIGATKTYAELVRAAELVRVDVTVPVTPDEIKRYTKRFHQKWNASRKSYEDLRRHGKTRCSADLTYTQAARSENEASLHRTIDEVARVRRRQIKRQLDARRWHLEQRLKAPPRRLLYLLKQPRTLVEARFLLEALSWLLSDHPTPVVLLHENTSKSVNAVSDEAQAGSNERDQRGPPKRQRVVFLSRAEEADLARRAKDGDVPARNRLFIAQWPLVASIARKHANSRNQMEDLIQQAYGGVNGNGSPVGLVRALDKFDPDKGIRLRRSRESRSSGLCRTTRGGKTPRWFRSMPRSSRTSQVRPSSGLRRKPRVHRAASVARSIAAL